MREAHGHIVYDPDKREWVPGTCIKCRLKLTQNSGSAIARAVNNNMKPVEGAK